MRLRKLVDKRLGLVLNFNEELIPARASPRRRVTMFVLPELECGGQNIAKHKMSWECQPVATAGAR